MNTTLTIKIEKKLRDEAKRTAKQMGIPLTAAINALVRNYVRDGIIVLDADCTYPSHIPNAETRRAIRDVKQRKNLVSFDSIEEWRAAMRSR